MPPRTFPTFAELAAGARPLRPPERAPKRQPEPERRPALRPPADASDASLTLRQAAALEGVAYKTILRWVRTGRLPAHRSGPRLLRILRSDLERFREQGRV
jgi:excisionase family DNA binding protein